MAHVPPTLAVDTALTYGDPTQTEVAAALNSTTVPRSEIFVTSKVPCCHDYPGAFPSLAKECSLPEFNGTTLQVLLGKLWPRTAAVAAAAAAAAAVPLLHLMHLLLTLRSRDPL